mgnify:CR=1 FL=1
MAKSLVKTLTSLDLRFEELIHLFSLHFSLEILNKQCRVEGPTLSVVVIYFSNSPVSSSDNIFALTPIIVMEPRISRRTRACLKNVKTPKQRIFFRCAALKILEIRQDSCEFLPCPVEKSLAVGHSAIYQTSPNYGHITVYSFTCWKVKSS